MGNLQVKKTVGDHSQQGEEVRWKGKVFLHCIHEPGDAVKVYPLLC